MAGSSGIVCGRYPHSLAILEKSTHQISPCFFPVPLLCLTVHLMCRKASHLQLYQRIQPQRLHASKEYHRFPKKIK